MFNFKKKPFFFDRLLGDNKNGKPQIVVGFFMVWVIFFIACFFILNKTGFADPDSFYHLKISKQIISTGFVQKLPQLQFTRLKDNFTDHHFLYHILLIPFILIFGDFWGLFISACFFASLVLAGFYLFLRIYKIKFAFLYTLILFGIPNFLFRITLVKAGALSLIILFAGIYFIFEKKYWKLFILSFFYVWSYGGFPLLFGMGIFYLAAYGWINIVNRWKEVLRAEIIYFPMMKFFIQPFLELKKLKILAIIGFGIIIGLVFNPYFPGNLAFYWVQIFKIAVVNNFSGVMVGAEWYSYSLTDLVYSNLFIFMLLSLSVPLFFLKIKKMDRRQWFFGISMLFFFLYTLKSKRNIEYFAPFVVFFSAFSINVWLEKFSYKKIFSLWFEQLKQNLLIRYFCLYVIGFMFIWGGIQLFWLKKNTSFFPWHRYDPAMLWMKKNIPQGEIIFHSDWDDFPILFYKDEKHKYIVGLDPTFMYDYDPKKYILWRDIVWAKRKNKIAEVIKNDFHSEYVFVCLDDQSDFNKVLGNDKEFKLLYRDFEVAIYKVNG